MTKLQLQSLYAPTTFTGASRTPHKLSTWLCMSRITLTFQGCHHAAAATQQMLQVHLSELQTSKSDAGRCTHM